MPGRNKPTYGLAAGLVEDKHESSSILDDDDIDEMTRRNNIKLIAAQHELEEECHLIGGTWIELTTGKSDTYMDKYATTTIKAYLVIDPQQAVNPKPLDEEEEIEIITNVTIPQILQLIQHGEMNVVGGWGCLLAIQKLRNLGEIS